MLIQCTCLTCGQSFQREPHRMVGPTYCSRPCFYKRKLRSILVAEDGSKALIPLLDKRGDVRSHAMIDAADAEWAAQWNWCQNGSGYVVRSAWIDGRTVMLRLHRELLGLTRGDGLIADHINRDPLDNRRANLRVVTARENSQNISPRQGASSQYRGVHWSARDQKWRAVVRDGSETYSLGSFDSEEAAAEAARKARAWLLPHAVD